MVVKLYLDNCSHSDLKAYGLPPFYVPGAVRVGSTVTDVSSARRSAVESGRGHISPNSAGVRYPNERYTLLRHDAKYQEVRELVEALELLAGPKLGKAMAFVSQAAEEQVRTNNHVERMNRRVRFAEKIRYRWR